MCLLLTPVMSNGEDMFKVTPFGTMVVSQLLTAARKAGASSLPEPAAASVQLLAREGERPPIAGSAVASNATERRSVYMADR